MANEFNSKDPYLHLVTGNFDLVSKDPGKAANAFERAIYYDANSYIAYVKLGRIYTEAKNFSEALKAFSSAVKIDSNGILVYRYLGDLFYSFAKYPEAKQSYQKYLEKGEVNTAIEERYSHILFFNKDYEECNQAIDKLIAVNSDNPVLFRLKAYISYETGNYPEGLHYIEKFFEIQDTGKIIPTDYVYFGRLLIKNQQDSLGITKLIIAAELDSTKTDTFEEIAKQFSKTKNHEHAILWFTKVMNAKPESAENTCYQIGREYYMWAQDTSVNADSLSRLAYYLEADSSFTKLIELKPDSYLGYFFRARTRARLDPETIIGLAKEDYEKTLSILESGDTLKTKNYLVECYRYLAFYFYMMNESKIQPKEPNGKSNIENSIYYWKKILEYEPADTQALTAVETLQNMN